MSPVRARPPSGRTSAGAPVAAVVAALAAVYVVWGSTYYAIRVAIDTMPPLLMAGVRFLVAGALLYGWAVRRGDREGDRPRSVHWRSALIVGTALLAVGNGGVTLAEQAIPSGIVALLVATVPLWMAILAHLGGSERLRPLAAAGIAVGLAGTALLLHPAGGSAPVPVMLATLAAPLTWAAGSLYARSAPLPSRPLLGSGMEMLAGGAVLVAAAVATGELRHVHPGAISLGSALAMAYLVVFGSLVAFSCYVWLLGVARTSLVSTYAYVNPLVAVLLGWALRGEPVSRQTLVAGALIVVAVAVVVRGSRPRRSARPRPQAEPLTRASPTSPRA